MSNYYNRQWRLPNNENKDKQSNYSMDFDAANSQVVNIDHNSVFNLGTSFTISGWFNFSSNKYQGLISFDNTSPRGWFLFQLADNSIKLFDGTSAFTLKTSYTTTNQWDSFIVTYDGTDLVFYVNGTQESTQAVSVNLQTNGNDGQIGNNKFSTGRYFNGKIDGLSIFNYALSSGQVTTLSGSSSTGIGNPMSLSPKPVAYYPLGDKDAFNGANYLVPNIAAEEADGDIATSYSPYALEFDAASSDYIDLGTTLNSMLELSDSFSVSAWINFENTSTDRTIISNFTSAIKGVQLRVLPNESIRIIIAESNSKYLFVDSTSLSTNTWHHTVFTYDGSNTIGGLNLYINSSLDNNTNGTAGAITTITSSDSLKIGAYTSGQYFNGKLSNLSAWNTALTSAQVTELYNEGVPSNLNNHSAYSNLTSWWQLGSNSSFNTNWTVLDEKGTNNGTSSNMGEDAIVDGIGSYANGLSSGMGGDEVIGDAPYSSANSLSVNMDIEDRVSNTPS
ncbi:MAG: putative concanavalin A-like lectin/glucanases superfamily protein [Prokaryotic dsDNA virus sp.]|nr:MAG: putative concanavalin A-like lectin/glucanases superfamily protein [Prokaryotic dsDNA virus sp.]|tara:strand:- start:224 stop:1738 length:1515 start_codon:yes stop_codon:yes gene_type:complete